MARIPYSDPDRPEAASLAASIVEERGSVLHLYAMLLHSLPLAEGWLGFMTAVRQKCALPGRIRELIILQVGRLNDATYEVEQHAPLALQEGVTLEQINILPDWQDSNLFAPAERAALAYCDAMTRNVHVPAQVFAEVRQHFDARLLVELTTTIASYNMVSRFLEALEIASADSMEPAS